jgi:hypothetical protein
VKKLLSWLIVFGLILAIFWFINPRIFTNLSFDNDPDGIKSAWESGASNIVVEAKARVILELPDEDDIGHKQRFRVELDNGHRVLISHDLEIAPRVPVSVHSTIRFRGEFDWTEAGGTIHWTHRDPNGKRKGGWIDHLEQRYQ